MKLGCLVVSLFCYGLVLWFNNSSAVYVKLFVFSDECLVLYILIFLFGENFVFLNFSHIWWTCFSCTGGGGLDIFCWKSLLGLWLVLYIGQLVSKSWLVGVNFLLVLIKLKWCLKGMETNVSLTWDTYFALECLWHGSQSIVQNRNIREIYVYTCVYVCVFFFLIWCMYVSLSMCKHIYTYKCTSCYRFKSYHLDVAEVMILESTRNKILEH